MLLIRKNLQSELLEHRDRAITANDLLQEVESLFKTNSLERQQIIDEIQTGDIVDSNHFIIEHVETDCIFHISNIKKLCIDYRFRFLESKYFKHGIPEEALTKIRMLEKTHQTTLCGFMIAAPSKSFKLQNYDDPLLFTPIGNKYYYLIHKWGNDVHPLRKWQVLPFRNLGNFVIFCLVTSMLLTWLTPLDNLSRQVPMATIIIFLFMFKSIVAVFLYAFFMLGKNFNSAIWNSKFYNN